MWQGWSCGLVHCPGGNAIDPIWRVLDSSDGISSWTALKPQHSNPNANPLANQLWCSEFLTPPTPLIIPHRLPGLLESLMPLKNWCSIHAKCSKSSLKLSIRFCGIPSLKQNFIAYRSSKVSSRPDCIFEIHLLWQSGFSRVYSNSYCSCSFEAEIVKIGQSSHMMYSNNILNFQVSTTFLNTCTKNLETYWIHHVLSQTDLFKPCIGTKHELQYRFCIELEPGPLGWDTFRLAVWTDTRIRSDVSWLWRQSVEATWHGFREAGIHIPRAETGAPWASGVGGILPGSNPPRIV